MQLWRVRYTYILSFDDLENVSDLKFVFYTLNSQYISQQKYEAPFILVIIHFNENRLVFIVMIK